MHFILFHGPLPLPKIGFPATHFHKTESVLHPQIFIPRGEIARPFWSRQLSKSSRIVCEALYRPAEALTPLPLLSFTPYRTPSTPIVHSPLFDPPLLFFPSREFDSSRFYERHGWPRGGKQGGGSVWSTGNRKELKRDETRRWRIGRREWFCSKIYPLLRLSFLKIYLILSGKIWK